MILSMAWDRVFCKINFVPFFLSSPWMQPGIKLGNEGHLGDFIDGLGPAQIVGRQVLASPSMGEIQLALFDRKGILEVEVIRAKGLLPKPGSKILPGKVQLKLS